MQTNLQELEKSLENILLQDIQKIIFSQSTKQSKYKKIIIENKITYYLITALTEKQSFNSKLTKSNLKNTILDNLEYFRQTNIFTSDAEYMIKQTKKDKIFLTKQNKNLAIKINSEHNRAKKYILNEGQVIPPLVDMGIMSTDGKIINSMRDKYRQINRFLEIIDDAIYSSKLNNLNIVDFGCDKSYLTFVVYYYLKFIKNINVNIIGLDLKEDVIKNCNLTAQKYGYTNLKFYVGDIKDYLPEFQIDMIITLHACDTATDYALYNAIKWNAKMIFSVPCCQHEVNQQISSSNLNILCRYGIAKERASAIFTDIVRCNLLESQGYKVDLLEFIDLDAIPKNLLIRAQKTNIPQNVKLERLKEVENLMNEFHFEQTLYSLLKKQG